MGNGGPGKPEDRKQIKSKGRVRDFGEVFTKPETVSDMVSLIPEEMLEPERN